MSIWLDLLGAEVRYRGKQYRTRCIEAGSGDTLILVHGVGGHAEAYSRNVMRLARDFHVVAIDLQWHGLSGKPPFDRNMVATYGKALIDLLDDMGVQRAHVEGESLGGRVAMHLGLSYPDRVNKLVLNTAAGVAWKEGTVKIDNASGTDLLRERSLAAIKNPTKETIRKRLEWLMASPDRVTDELVDLRYALYTLPETNASLTNVFENSFGDNPHETYSEEEVGHIKAPTLVLWTDKNPGRGLDVGQRLASLIPGAQFYGMMDAAHWPQWEHPEEHDEVVAAFLKGK